MHMDPTCLEQAEFIYQNMRLKTRPVGVRFLEKLADAPKEARRPSAWMGKRITVCQGMTMARNYGWQMALGRDDMACPLAALALGLGQVDDVRGEMAASFHTSQYKCSLDAARKEVAQMCFLEPGRYEGMFVGPLHKMTHRADSVVLYGNPAQISRLVQAATYALEQRIEGLFGGKVECPEYLIRPFHTRRPRIALPGPGDRIFSMTGDDEMILAFPHDFMDALVTGLKECGRRMGARYPITVYQNFEPAFPEHYQALSKKIGL